MSLEASMIAVLTNENTFSVSRVGSAVEADKKINLALQISFIVHALGASRKTAQRRPADVRGHGLYPASGLPMARPADALWIMEFGLYPLAALVWVWALDPVVAGIGARRSRSVAVLGCQSYQGASGRQQSLWWPAKSSHWTHQRRSEHQTECLGGRRRTSDQSQLGGGATGRCHRSPNLEASTTPRNDHSGRQRLRQRRISRGVAALREPPVYSTALQSSPAGHLASRPLPQTTQGRELVSALEALPQSRNAL